MSIPNWKTVKEYEDITFKKSNGVARIAFNRPEVRNAFRPKTVFSLNPLVISYFHKLLTKAEGIAQRATRHKLMPNVIP